MRAYRQYYMILSHMLCNPIRACPMDRVLMIQINHPCSEKNTHCRSAMKIVFMVIQWIALAQSSRPWYQSSRPSHCPIVDTTK